MPRFRAARLISFRALVMFAACCFLPACVQSLHAAEESSRQVGSPEPALPEPWQLAAPENNAPYQDITPEGDGPAANVPIDPYLSESYTDWDWQWLPEGLIYHTYMAGVHEPRMALVTFYEASEGRTLMDAALGGRIGIVKYGNCDPTQPEGYQLDFYGASIPRLDVENEQDVDSCDYVFGLPLTWGDEQLQFQFGYAHLSSHLGDEFAISHPGSLANRVNYVRDSFEFGTSYYPIPIMRTYGQIGWAFHRSGGAGPFAAQFGTELSRPGWTHGELVPFLAINARLRDDKDFGGDLNFQTGWLRRGMLGQTLRFGLQYYNGKSDQSQFFRTSEQQIGFGIWYDF